LDLPDGGIIVTLEVAPFSSNGASTNERMEVGVSFSVYDITVPVMVHGLNVMDDYLKRHR
jgi:hypothetical protein